MTFSSEIKKILCTCEYSCPGCRLAELAGFFECTGRLGEKMVRYKTVIPEVSSHMINAVKDEFGIDITEINAGDLKRLNDTLSDEAIINDCCKTAYIRGAFLGGGSVSNPEKEYHMEFSSKDTASAKKLRNMIEDYGLKPKMTGRRGKDIVYLKESSQIADLIGYISGGRAGLEILSVQVEKELISSTQRRVNCDSANLNKQAIASLKHINAVKKIKAAHKWSALPEVLREIGELREMYPDVSIEALGKMTKHGVGKSGTNHRLNRIVEIADSL